MDARNKLKEFDRKLMINNGRGYSNNLGTGKIAA